MTAAVQNREEIWLDRDEILRQEKNTCALRRFQDILISFMMLFVLSPLLLILMLLIYLDDPKGSPIYISQRIGQDGRLFKFYKLRSMRVGADQELVKLLSQNEMDGPDFKIRKDPRITRIGRFIRKCSIDELPQFYNVLKGDMSIVGPRPAIPREVAQYMEYQRQRLYVKPGLTCYWQVTPRRNDLSFDEWVQLDLAYIRDRNFLLDWKLIFRTVRVMLMGEGE